jgi:hypothetical protein
MELVVMIPFYIEGVRKRGFTAHFKLFETWLRKLFQPGRIQKARFLGCSASYFEAHTKVHRRNGHVIPNRDKDHICYWGLR